MEMLVPSALQFVAFVLLALAPQGVQEKQILFEAPEGSTDTDRTKAAKALAARCVAQGMAGVTGDTVRRAANSPRQIRLLSPKGFTAEQIPAVDFLASFPCRSVQMRLEHFLNRKEKEQYGDGKSAPKGMTWTKLKTWKYVEKPFPHYQAVEQGNEQLFLDKPVIDATAKCGLLRHPGGDLHGYDRESGVYMTFKGSLVKAMHDSIVPNPEEPGKTMLPLNLFIDGVCFPTNDGMMGWRILQPKAKDPDLAIWTFPGLTEESPLGTLLEHPLPFALKRIE